MSHGHSSVTGMRKLPIMTDFIGQIKYLKNTYMKNLTKTIISLFLVFLMAGCSDFLDVVPDNTPSLDDAFSNRAVMEKFMHSCYSYLPDPTDPIYYPAYRSEERRVG